jgi:hypothetical protein
MSEEQKFGQASIEADAGYTPMSDAYAPPPPEPAKEYSSDLDGIKEVARDLEDERRRRRGDSDSEPTPRNYVHIGGDRHGEAMPENQTISLERASDDLTRQRAAEVQAAQPMQAEVASAIDQARANYAAAQQATQQQPEQQQPPDVQAQQPVDGIDAEIRQALENPKIRQALEAEVQAAENARQQYANATRQAAQLAGASLLAAYPELANVPSNQLQTAIQVIGVRDPQRAQAINAHLERVQALFNASQQAQQAQQQIQAQRVAIEQQRVAEFFKAEDAKFEKSIANESAETKRAVTDNGARILQDHYGVDLTRLLRRFSRRQRSAVPPCSICSGI